MFYSILLQIIKIKHNYHLVKEYVQTSSLSHELVQFQVYAFEASNKLNKLLGQTSSVDGVLNLYGANNIIATNKCLNDSLSQWPVILRNVYAAIFV